MKRELIIAVTAFLLAAGGALAQTDKPTSRPAPMWRSQKGTPELKLTDEQKKDVQKIKFDLMQKQIDLRSKLAHARLEYQQLTSGDSPDQAAIAAKIDEIATLQSQMKKNLLGGWFAINKILTPEQQKIWKKVLEHPRRAASRMMIRMRMNARPFGGQNGGMMMMNRSRVGMGDMMESGGSFGQTDYSDDGLGDQSELGPLADADILNSSDEALSGDWMGWTNK